MNEQELSLSASGSAPDERKKSKSKGATASGCDLIYNERVRQIEVKRRAPEQDRRINARGELAQAGACYALLAGGQSRATELPGGAPDVLTLAPLKQWPWSGAAWKPSNNRLRNLVRAGALIAAEIDRLVAEGERLEGGRETSGTENASS